MDLAGWAARGVLSSGMANSILEQPVLMTPELAREFAQILTVLDGLSAPQIFAALEIAIYHSVSIAAGESDEDINALIDRFFGGVKDRIREPLNEIAARRRSAKPA